MPSPSFVRIPQHWQSETSFSLMPRPDCRLAQALTAVAAEKQQQTGFRLISEEADALASRIQLIEQADTSLDMQYYKWLDDRAGSLLLSHVVAAADRGVRVRLLIDDIHFDADLNAQALDHHPNINIRLFNPFESRRLTPFTRPFEWLRNSRVNHRMHNKLILADSLVGLCGGRNISDCYFGTSETRTFRDLDLLVTGKVINHMSQAFDSFWNSHWAVPVNKLLTVKLPERQQRRLQLMLRRFKRSRQYGQTARLQALVEQPAKPISDGLLWATARLVYDPPDKVTGELQPGPMKPNDLLLNLKISQSFHLITPYLIPTPNMSRLFEQLHQRGVRVKILTNSLASTDVVMAHGGYRTYRRALLQAGVKLYEFSPSARFASHSLVPYSLHAKVLVLDGQQVFLGTHNADPRSFFLNTEMGLLIDSPELAQQVLSLFQRHLNNGNTSL